MKKEPSERRQRRLLKKLDPDFVSPIPRRGEKVPCIVTDVYDGDTLTAIYIYQGAPLKIRLRIFGIDAPEIRKKGNTDLEKEAAIAVKNFVIKWLKNQDSKKLYLQISKFDKYGGRYIGDILVNVSDHKEPAYKSLSETLLEADLVKPYTGSMKQPWESSKLRKIVKEAE